MSEGGVSPTNIAVQVGISGLTVHRWLKRWQEEHTVEDRPRPGPSRTATETEDQRIVEDVLTHPFTIAVATKHQLQLPRLQSAEQLLDEGLEYWTGLELFSPTRKHLLQHPTGNFIAGEQKHQVKSIVVYILDT